MKITKKIKKKLAKFYNLPVTQKQASEMNFNDLINLKWKLFYKTEEKKRHRYLPVNGWKIVEKSIDKISCHPTPEDFRPVLKLNRKKKYGVLFVYDSEYKSNKHYNSIMAFWIDEKKCKSDGNSFWILVNYELYRSNLTYSRKRYFSFIAGYDDGSVFVNRIAPSDTIDEALEKMKPAIVQKAEKEGKIVLRQGDVFFVEMKRSNIEKYQNLLPPGHKLVIKDGKYYISHNEHSFLYLPHSKFKPITNKVIGYAD